MKKNHNYFHYFKINNLNTMLHKFRDWHILPQTQLLFLGTFHPDINTGTDIFYGRSRNFLWRILPACFDENDLKNSPLQEKIEFLERRNISFADIIFSLNDLPIGEEANYRDDFIDNYIESWNNIEEKLATLPNIKSVFFTRSTLNNIPNISNRILEIREHCINHDISFNFLITPARFCNQEKIAQWREKINPINP